MSTTTATYDTTAASITGTAEPRKSFFARIIEARSRQGEARVRAVFERMSDRQLADIGFNPDQIRSVRATGRIPAEFWA